jgi:hypothetical protein
MIQGLTNTARQPERELGGVTRRSELGQGLKGPGGDLEMTSDKPATEAPVLRTNKVDEYAAIINFELVPSGRIHMNREVREHIVDFFQ